MELELLPIVGSGRIWCGIVAWLDRLGLGGSYHRE